MTFEFGIVNHNGGEALLDCIASIDGLDGAPHGIFCFDNASVDGSAEEAARRFPHITAIRSDINLGYAGALNRLLERMTADAVVLCNMDLRFDGRWTSVIEDAFRRHPEADSVASLVLEMGEPPVVNSAGIGLFADLHAQNIGSGQPYVPESLPEAEVLGGYGAVMCFRREAIQDLAFDEDYFLFFEETDFFLRFRLLGRHTVRAPDAIVYHHRSLTTQRYSPLKLYYGERNRLTTIFKLLPVWYWPVAFGHTIRRLLRVSRALPTSSGAGPPMPGTATILWTLLRAWTAAALRLPGTLRKRAAFRRESSAGPREALMLVRRHGIAAEELSVR